MEFAKVRYQLLTILLLFALVGFGFPQESAVEIVKKSDELLRGRTQYGIYTMTVVRPDWQRSMKFKFWSEGTEKAFILVLSPAKEKGVTFLKLNNESRRPLIYS